MAFKVTKKDVLENYCVVVCVGYCELQTLLQSEFKIAYTAGVYGWNSDIYHLDGALCVCTGYRPFGNFRPSYTLIDFYEKKARDCNDYENLKSLLDTFRNTCYYLWKFGEGMKKAAEGYYHETEIIENVTRVEYADKYGVYKVYADTIGKYLYYDVFKKTFSA